MTRFQAGIRVLGLGLAFTACASAGPPVAATPADIPALEAAVAGAPDDAQVLTLLGVAYQSAGRHEDAVRTLERARGLDGAAPVAALYLGLSLEELERWQEARTAYADYLASDAGDDDVRRDVQRRLALAERELLDDQARALLEQEAALSALPPEPRSVAVFPFRVMTDDARFAPLEFALADMVTTDLGIPGVLVLLERSQIQALVREMALTLAGYTEPATGARLGRLMRAEHVVQGSVELLPDERVRLEMAVLDAASRERTGGAEDEGALAEIFDAEKQLVLGVLDALGVTLTPAEREQIEENRAANLIAFLAYGEGLMAMENGDYAAAVAAFGQATQLDPGFGAAASRRQQAADLQQAAAGTAQLAENAASQLALGTDPRGGALDDVVDRTNPNPGSQYTGDDGGSDLAHNGLDGNDTSDDQNEGFIANPGHATVFLPIPNPNPQ